MKYAPSTAGAGNYAPDSVFARIYFEIRNRKSDRFRKLKGKILETETLPSESRCLILTII